MIRKMLLLIAIVFLASCSSQNSPKEIEVQSEIEVQDANEADYITWTAKFRPESITLGNRPKMETDYTAIVRLEKSGDVYIDWKEEQFVEGKDKPENVYEEKLQGKWRTSAKLFGRNAVDGYQMDVSGTQGQRSFWANSQIMIWDNSKMIISDLKFWKLNNK